MNLSSLTRNQRLVYRRLRRAGRPLSAYDLLDALRVEGLRAPLQIYRALGRLRELGLVHRIESLNAFMACDASHIGGAEAFAICASCGRTQEIEIEAQAASWRRWARVAGFRLEKSVTELTGLCARCEGK